MLKAAAIITLFISLICLPGKLEAKAVDEHIYIVPVGNIDKDVIGHIKSALRDSLPMSVNVALESQKELPEGAYDPSRKQYNAQMVLDAISRKIYINAVDERALLIVDVDLYVPELNFVFGLADAKKGMCIMSLARLRNEYYGLKSNKVLFLNRALKEAIHELGHSWGLAHCSNRKCVMFFSNSLSDTDRKRSEFCRDCRNKLHRRYGSPLLGSLPLLQK